MTLVLTRFGFGDNFSYNVINHIVLHSIDLAVICISVPREKEIWKKYLSRYLKKEIVTLSPKGYLKAVTGLKEVQEKNQNKQQRPQTKKSTQWVSSVQRSGI